jgi:nucleolar protein 58
MLVLYETPAGYALFKMLDSKALDDPDAIESKFSSADKANQT